MSDEIKYLYLKNHPLFASFPDKKIKDACSIAIVKNVVRGVSFG